MWCTGGGRRTQTHTLKLCGSSCVHGVSTHTYIRTTRTADLSRFVPDVTCSLTKFWPLHHSFKIAKSVQRNYIFTHSDISWRSSDAVAPLSALPVRLHFTLGFLYDHKSSNRKKGGERREGSEFVKSKYMAAMFFCFFFLPVRR